MRITRVINNPVKAVTNRLTKMVFQYFPLPITAYTKEPTPNTNMKNDTTIDMINNSISASLYLLAGRTNARLLTYFHGKGR